jgi:hypothetical protein
MAKITSEQRRMYCAKMRADRQERLRKERILEEEERKKRPKEQDEPEEWEEDEEY